MNFFDDQGLIKYLSCSYHECVRIDCQALYLIFGSSIFDLNFLSSYFAEVFHCPSPKWRPFSSSYPSCYVVPPVTLFIVTTSEQRSPIIHLKRCVLLSFVLFFKLAILIQVRKKMTKVAARRFGVTLICLLKQASFYQMKNIV